MRSWKRPSAIIILTKRKKLLKDIKELLKEILRQFVKAFSSDTLNFLRNLTVLDLNQFMHLLINSAL
uniref:Uncharacterized protein n=1 Tax=Rhizophagus irregularis (strain DAOM 181602 / DAOM 197198 / MUCL 43194) TaxID=747089 RepID=U9T9I6_RHIID